jgi:hypothetical protein
MTKDIKLNILLLPVSLLLVGKLIIAISLSFLPFELPAMIIIYAILLLGIVLFCVKKENPLLFFRRATYNELWFWSFFALCACSLFYRDAYRPLVEEKLVLIAYNIILPIYIIYIIGVFYPIRLKELEPILRKVSFASIIICALAFGAGAYTYVDSGTRLLINGIDNPIWLSRYLSLAIFCILYVNKGYRKAPYILIALLGMFFLYKSGSRGPMLALFVALGLTFWKQDRKLFYAMLILSGSLLLIAVAYLNTRLLNFDLSQDYSSLARLEYFTKVFESKIDPLWGFGLGNFGYVILNITERVYPHNIFLEIFFETGLITTVIFIVLLFKTFAQNSSNAIYYLFLISFINSNLSGDLSGNAEFFIFMFLLLKYSNDGKYTLPQRP